MSLEMRWKELGVRASVRKRRLHACGCFRLERAGDLEAHLVAWVERAEQLADGQITAAELTVEGRSRPAGGDASLATLSDDDLNQVWDACVVHSDDDEGLDHTDSRVVARLRVLEDLVGPAGPVLSPAWLTDTAVSLARGMYESRDFSAMPILADALQDAGCDNADILTHCRDANQPHVRGCWVVDLVLGKE